METHSDNIGFFQHFLTLNKSLFNQEQYEAAYHILAAAYHVAVDADSTKLLRQIEVVAQEQARWIDQYDPDHPYSCYAPYNQVHKYNIFCGLVVMVQARMRMGTHFKD